MKQANVELKKQFKNVSIDEVEVLKSLHFFLVLVQNLQDDLTDLLDQTNEIQDILGRSYDVDIDESELDDGTVYAGLNWHTTELAALGDELALEAQPSYLSAAALPDVQADTTGPYGTAQPLTTN